MLQEGVLLATENSRQQSGGLALDGQFGANLTSPAVMQELEICQEKTHLLLATGPGDRQNPGLFCGDFERTLWKFNREIGLGTQ